MGKIIDHFLFFAHKIHNDTVILDKDETKHALTVLRIVIGDSIFVTDGKGTIYFCNCINIQSDCCEAIILREKKQEIIGPHLQVFVGIPEKNSFESLLKSLVPLGVVNIIPVECRNCQKKWWLKNWGKNLKRFKMKMITAAKQSWNAWIPQLSSPVSFNSAISANHGLILVADENGEELINYLNNSIIKSSKIISCFVGPPGGFTNEELTNLRKLGSFSVKISQHRLRTELAATILVGSIVQLVISY